MSTYPSLYKSLPSNRAPTKRLDLLAETPSEKLKKAVTAIILLHYSSEGGAIDSSDLPYDMSYDGTTLSFDTSSFPPELLSKIGELVRMSSST